MDLGLLGFQFELETIYPLKKMTAPPTKLFQPSYVQCICHRVVRPFKFARLKVLKG